MIDLSDLICLEPIESHIQQAAAAQFEMEENSLEIF